MFKSIVVGYDGSDPSVRALETACGLAKLHGAELHVVYTPEQAMSEFGGGDTNSTPDTVVIEDATGIAQSVGIILTSATIGKTEPENDILEIAQLYDAGLIVTGRRGLGSVSGIFLGSTSQKLAHSAKCACLTVP